jgi:regulator of sirC expression with transglutaminase-like and TPR domain
MAQSNPLFKQSTPLDYFASLVARDDDFALFEAAVSIAQDEYELLDIQAVLSEVDQLLARIQRRLPADAGPMQKLKTLNQFFYSELGFGANVNNFYDPDNSYINVLLRTRRGIPISLAVLWMELAQSLGLVVQGVGFPGHFMLKVTLPMGQAIIDPVSGKSQSLDDLSALLGTYHLESDPANPLGTPLGRYLRAATPRTIISRMLNNLKEIYESENDLERQAAVRTRLLILMDGQRSL